MRINPLESFFLRHLKDGGFQTYHFFYMMKVGDRVRVTESVIVYHHPEHRNQPFDLKGSEGEISAILEDWQGRPISPNLPVNVKFRQFQKPFTAHFRPDELECIASSDS